MRELWLRRVAKVNFHSPRSNLPRELTFARDLRRCGCGWIRTTEAEKQQIYSLPHLATLEHTLRRNSLATKKCDARIWVAAVAPLKITNLRYASIFDFGFSLINCSMFSFSRFAERESLLSDSNQRPLDYKSSALPTELKRRLFQQPFSFGAKSDAKVQQIFHSRKLFSQNPTDNPVFRKICQLVLTF